MGEGHSKPMDSNSVTSLSYLEEGQFSKLYKGVLKDTRMAVTIKVPRVPEYIRKDRKQVKIHIEEAKKLLNTNFRKPKAENIVQNLNVAYDDFRKEIWVVREYVDGMDLETIMKNPSLCPSLMSPEERMRVAVGIAKGMSYLHNMRFPIVHGDFKPSDIMLTAKAKIPKITNYGLWDFKKFFIENTVPSEVVFLNPHQAPEVLISEERPTLCSDVWSIASVILQWIVERPPWDFQDLCNRYQYRMDKQDMALRDAMENKEEPSVSYDLQDETLSFLKPAFNYEPTARPRARQILEGLDSASRTPTWTNVAFHKYYNNQSLKSV